MCRWDVDRHAHPVFNLGTTSLPNLQLRATEPRDEDLPTPACTGPFVTSGKPLQQKAQDPKRGFLLAACAMEGRVRTARGATIQTSGVRCTATAVVTPALFLLFYVSISAICVALRGFLKPPTRAPSAHSCPTKRTCQQRELSSPV